jgi:hypothetical protein
MYLQSHLAIVRRDPSTLETQTSSVDDPKHENFDADHESDSALEDIFQFNKIEPSPQPNVNAPPSTASSTGTVSCPPSWEGYSTRTPIR